MSDPYGEEPGPAAAEAVRRWAAGRTDADIDRMTEETAKGMHQIIGFAEVLQKLKQADNTGLSHVVLGPDEIKHLLHAFRLLTSKKDKA